MERFVGQPLREKPHLAVLFYDSIGDFVVATPLLRGLREKYPGCVVDYFSGERTRELEEASRLLDWRYSIFGVEGSLRALPDALAERERIAGPYELAINLDYHHVNEVVATMLQPRYVMGACFEADARRSMPHPTEKVDGLHNEFWSAPDLLERYAGVLGSHYIGEIFCRLARVETDYFRTEVPVEEPPVEVPPILISTGGNRSAKLWEQEYWLGLLRWAAAEGLQVGLLGGKPSVQARYYNSATTEDILLAAAAGTLVDLRGVMTLPQVAGALQKTKGCVTVDNGIMHIAAAVGTPTLAIFGASPWKVWAPRSPNLHLVLPTEPCPMCEDNRFRNDACLRDRHVCMLSIPPEMVIERLQAILAA